MANWNKTRLMTQRIGNHLENGFYQGRPIIHRDSPIDRGVSLGEGEREAIVVDSEKYPEIKKLYEVAKKKASRNGIIEKGMVLRAVYDTVKEALKYDNDAVEDLVKKYDVKNDGKISLDVFLRERAGVCRHDALAAGVLLELFKRDGIIRGKPSVDRSSDPRGSHSWGRYTNSAGEVYILDIALGYLGSLEESLKRPNGWDYRRPEEIK